MTLFGGGQKRSQEVPPPCFEDNWVQRVPQKCINAPPSPCRDCVLEVANSLQDEAGVWRGVGGWRRSGEGEGEKGEGEVERESGEGWRGRVVWVERRREGGWCGRVKISTLRYLRDCIENYKQVSGEWRGGVLRASPGVNIGLTRGRRNRYNMAAITLSDWVGWQTRNYLKRKLL